MYVDETSIILPPSRFVGRMSKIYFSTKKKGAPWNTSHHTAATYLVSHIIKLMSVPHECKSATSSIIGRLGEKIWRGGILIQWFN